MLGVVVLASGVGSGETGAEALFTPFVGVPMLARAIAASLSSVEPVLAAVVVPAGAAERVQTEVVTRFGLTEVEHVIEADTDAAGLAAALAALDGHVQTVVVSMGDRVFVGQDEIAALASAAHENGAAAFAIAPQGVVVNTEGELDAPAGVYKQLVLPAAAPASDWQAVADAGFEGHDALLSALLGTAAPALVDAQPDNMALTAPGAAARGLEVFHRRADEMAFLFPRDLLPEDPLAAALLPGEPAGDTDGPVAEALAEEAAAEAAAADAHADPQADWGVAAAVAEAASSAAEASDEDDDELGEDEDLFDEDDDAAVAEAAMTADSSADSSAVQPEAAADTPAADAPAADAPALELEAGEDIDMDLTRPMTAAPGREPTDEASA